MNLLSYLSVAKSLVKAKIFRRKSPLAVSWVLTYRCNLSCKYCGFWRQSSGELSTGQIFMILDEIAQANVQWISFTGGEPLVRDDIGDIIGYAKSKGIFVNLNTNATLIGEKIDEIRNTDSIQISLDGEEAVNDMVRGRGAYRAVCDALALQKRRDTKIRIQTVLSRYNLDNLDFIFEFIKKFRLPVIFQPATARLLGGPQINPHAPAGKEYVRTIDKIIRKKRRGYNIINSISGLKHLRHYPNDKKLVCAAGLINCDIRPDGTMLACGRYPFYQRTINLLKEGFIRGFNMLQPISCKQCWCASQVELNAISSFNPEAILNVLKDGYFN